ncbi:formate dehydrogenase accessory sulfurtransferase FdhD [Effusibacillus dendaii]|uniref:Sulfur carrier protein FdhD n=1 Tax=Effusibacillus dendaii TaxID=2743772 RepID=A0A7I8DCB7_9BACL|nr:formate dehydrogenase accessory sulfurtransferase FdhD [Effusibacillus dendaii]BCJ86160.1 sulfurtransferase FdhD [Effusibacillus dendaii]
MRPDVTVTRPIIRYENGQFLQDRDEIANEYALTVMVNYQEFATIVCTPDDLQDMVIGFLAAEGVIRSIDQITSICIEEKNGFAYVQTATPRMIDPTSYSKRIIGSCCGKSRQSFYFQNDARTAKKVRSQAAISAEDCIRLIGLLQSQSAIFRRTGGVHNAALCGPDGILISRTDIGRHNAIDKIYGHILQNRIPLDDTMLAFSGRISSEVLLKIAKIGVAILLSKAAPTETALDLAEELNITTVGFIRGGRFNIYTHPERITCSEAVLL